MSTIKSCGCIIIQGPKVLLVGAPDDSGKLFWSFPKGHQENDETDAQTALRETKEEVGLDVEIIERDPIITGHPIHHDLDYKEILLFLARPITHELKLQTEEITLAKWVSFAEAKQYLEDYYLDAWQKAQLRLDLLKEKQPVATLEISQS